MMNETSDRGERRLLRQAEMARDMMTLAEDAVARGEPADRTLNAFWRLHRQFGSRDRRLVSDTVFAAFRWRGWIGTMASEGPRILPRGWMIDRRSAPPPPLAHWDPSPAALPAPETAPMPDDPVIALELQAGVARQWRPACAAEDLVPAWFLKDLEPDPETGETAHRLRVIAHLQVRPPLWLRAIDTDAETFAARLRVLDVPSSIHSVLPGAVQARGAPNLTDLRRRAGVRFFAQDLSSQRVNALCAARAGERWWDACAGGGGKTLGLLAAVGAGGSVDATDVRGDALAETARRAQELGLPPPRIRTLDAAVSSPGHDFDGVLVDAPCSGTGTWARQPDARWRTRAADVAECAAVQTRLLESAARAVRPGGRLVYAVCSLQRAEGSAIIRAFGERHPEFAPVKTPRVFWPWDGPQIGMFAAAFIRS